MIVVKVLQYHRYWHYSDYAIPKVKIKHGKYRKTTTQYEHKKEGGSKMGKLLTTGQMIDMLEEGQIAERVYELIGSCSDAYTKAKLDEDGDLMFFVEQDNDWSSERLTGSVINSKWIIG